LIPGLQLLKLPLCVLPTMLNFLSYAKKQHHYPDNIKKGIKHWKGDNDRVKLAGNRPSTGSAAITVAA
jgi:hypothetical protein